MDEALFKMYYLVSLCVSNVFGHNSRRSPAEQSSPLLSSSTTALSNFPECLKQSKGVYIVYGIYCTGSWGAGLWEVNVPQNILSSQSGPCRSISRPCSSWSWSWGRTAWTGAAFGQTPQSRTTSWHSDPPRTHVPCKQEEKHGIVIFCN